MLTLEQAEQSLDNLKQYLIEQGWEISSTMDFHRTSVEWYAYKRLPEGASHCNCNSREPSLFLYPWLLSFNSDFTNKRYATSCEVELCATATPADYSDEDSKQDWINFKYYSIKPEDIHKKLPKITRALTQAWEAVWSVEHEEI